jgi:hypothetical protein
MKSNMGSSSWIMQVVPSMVVDGSIDTMMVLGMS